MRKIRITVPMSETAMDPRQPSRLEKKANIVVLSSAFVGEAVVVNSGWKNLFPAFPSPKVKGTRNE